MITIDERQYDEANLSDKGRVALGQIVRIQGKRQQLQGELGDLAISEKHYSDVLREESKDLTEITPETETATNVASANGVDTSAPIETKTEEVTAEEIN
jgi:hypothetical protein